MVAARWAAKKVVPDVPFPPMPEGIDLRITDFPNGQNLKLKTFRFAREKGSHCGYVFLCHGYAAHTQSQWFLPSAFGEPHEKWEGTVLQGLVDAGYIVHSVDQQSMGRSEGARGLRCYFEDFDDLPKENLEYLRQVVLKEELASDLPLLIFGISMGGATAVRMVQMEPNLFSGMILYSPMLSLEAIMKQTIFCCFKNRHLRPIAACLSKCFPTLPIGKPARNDDDSVQRSEKVEDPLAYHESARGRVSVEFYKVTSRFMNGGLADISVPFIVFHSSHDTFTDPAGSLQLFVLSRSSDKTYVKVGLGQELDLEMWHNLATEPGHDDVFQRTLSWIQDRVRPQPKDMP